MTMSAIPRRKAAPRGSMSDMGPTAVRKPTRWTLGTLWLRVPNAIPLPFSQTWVSRLRSWGTPLLMMTRAGAGVLVDGVLGRDADELRLFLPDGQAAWAYCAASAEPHEAWRGVAAAGECQEGIGAVRGVVIARPILPDAEVLVPLLAEGSWPRAR